MPGCTFSSAGGGFLLSLPLGMLGAAPPGAAGALGLPLAAAVAVLLRGWIREAGCRVVARRGRGRAVGRSVGRRRHWLSGRRGDVLAAAGVGASGGAAAGRLAVRGRARGPVAVALLAAC